MWLNPSIERTFQVRFAPFRPPLMSIVCSIPEENMRYAYASLLLVLAGCATPPKDNTVWVADGRVVQKEEYNVTQPPHGHGAYLPGMGGAIGGAVVGLLDIATTKKTKYFYYTIRASSGFNKTVLASDEYAIDDCLSIYAQPTKTESYYWTLGDAILRRSEACVTSTKSD